MATSLIRDEVDGSEHKQPLHLPIPKPYDVGTPSSGRCMASAWLFAQSQGVPTGAIAYLGETVVMPPNFSNEFQSYMLRASLAYEFPRLGDVWKRAQIMYWQKHHPKPVDNDLAFEHPRIYLSIMTLFGDPSLRLLKPKSNPSIRVLWMGNENRVSIWLVDQEGNMSTYTEHGPFEGWTPINISKNRILWRTSDGAGLWKIDDEGNQISYKEYRGIHGWQVINYSDNRILWVGDGNRISIWNLNENDEVLSYKEHGPFEEWTPINISKNRILWRTSDGAGLWKIDDQGNQISYKEYHGIHGWLPLNCG
jgi:hypothetical protein